MKVIVWIAEGTWPAAVDAARFHAPADADLSLLHVTDDDVTAAAHGAFTGLLGRGRPDRDPAHRLEAMSQTSEADLIDAATRRLGRPAAPLLRHGRVEHEVVQAAESADLLICARDGDRSHPGPHSIGPATRFVVDHARCPVLLVWS